MMAWIDKVRADLERYDPKSPALQRGQDGQRKRRLPRPALCSRDNYSFNRKPPLEKNPNFA